MKLFLIGRELEITQSTALVHDYPAVQGYTVLTVATVILINLTVEITYILSNPMVRRGGISRPTAQQ